MSPIITIIFVLLACILVFHILVILKKIPYQIVWGSRIKTDNQMYFMVGFSLFMNIIFIYILSQYANCIPYFFSEREIGIMIKFMSGYFFVNSIGNLTSKNHIEKRYFTPISLILAILLLSL